MDHIKALSITIHNLSLIEAKNLVKEYLATPKFHQIVTVNPDLIMMARRDREFFLTLNKADLSTIDGVGIYLPSLLQGKIPHGRISGSDFIEHVLSLSEHANLPVFLLVNDSGLSTFQETRSAIEKKFPRLKIFGANVSMQSPDSLNASLEKASKYPVVLSNFGGRLQEISLARLKHIPGSCVRLAMGTGGAFDFMTGKQKRAPFFIRKFGFEWLWRLILQPRRRLKRTWNYVVIYSLLCIKDACIRWIRTAKERHSHPSRKTLFLPTGNVNE